MKTQSCSPPQGGLRAPARRLSIARAAALVGVGAVTSLLLTACGGDSDNVQSSSTGNEVPASAVATSASFEAFALAQPLSETASPLLLDNLPATLPGSDSEAPITLP